MKKKYVSPEIKVVMALGEEPVLAKHSGDWIDSKKGFFDDEDDDSYLKESNLWDDDDPFGE